MTEFSEACDSVARAFGARQQLVADLARSRSFAKALARLRDYMRANAFEPFLSPFDHRTRQEGFHVLHDWDGKADHVSGEMIPVDVLDYVARLRGTHQSSAGALAVLLDYYYFHVLQLLSLRVWDSGDADANLDRLAQLLVVLQAPGGSGQLFVADAETLILVATSHFEAVERGYDRLLRRVKTLAHAHQVKVALGHASSMGCHLRFGFEATYGRDTLQMRDDNVADYPWLCFALATLMREYVRLREAGAEPAARRPIVEAIVNGMSPDARAFLGVAPPALVASAEDRAAFRDQFLAHRHDLLAEFESHRPVDGAYTPLSFFFNFSHNVLKGTVVDALLRGEPWNVSFNEMLTAEERTGGDRERLARTLMEHARANPDTIGGRPMPVIVYDPRAGHRAFRVMMEKVSAAANAPSP